MFDLKKKKLYAFLEDYCAEKLHILTSINHISSKTSLPAAVWGV